MKKIVFVICMLIISLSSVLSLVWLYSETDNKHVSINMDLVESIEKDGKDTVSVSRGSIAKSCRLTALVCAPEESIGTYEYSLKDEDELDFVVKAGSNIEKNEPLVVINHNSYNAKFSGKVLEVTRAKGCILIEAISLSKVYLKANLPSEIVAKNIDSLKIYTTENNTTLKLKRIEFDMEENVAIFIPDKPCFFPGELVDVEIITEEKEDVLILPTAAIIYNGDEYKVCINGKEGEYYAEIRLGIVSDGYAEVTSGALEGMNIVYPEEVISYAYHLKGLE